MIPKQDRVKPRTVEDLERKYNFARQFSQQKQASENKGADGLTPYIGANGNWWIGTTDTGVSASGSSVSFTPVVTEGKKIGTLTVDGVDTDVFAPAETGYDESSGEYYLKVGETILSETQLQALLALLGTQGVLYTNVLPTAIDCYGDVFFGKGYIDGHYLGGNKYTLDRNNYITAGSGYFSTGFIPYTIKQAENCIPFYVKGIDLNLSSLPENMKASLFSDYDRTEWQGFMVFATETELNNMTIEKLGDKYYKLTPNGNFFRLHAWDTQDTKYIRFSFEGSGAGVVITIDEPIE